MRRFISILNRLRADQRAATAVEYGLILALVVLAMFGALKMTATSTISMWDKVNNRVAEQ